MELAVVELEVTAGVEVVVEAVVVVINGVVWTVIVEFDFVLVVVLAYA